MENKPPEQDQTGSAIPDRISQVWKDTPGRDPDTRRRIDRKKRNQLLALAAAILIVLGFAIPALFESEPPPVPVSVKALQGSAMIKNAVTGDVRELQLGDSLPEGAEIITAGDGRVGLAYANYELRLNRNTRIQIRRMNPLIIGGEIHFKGHARQMEDEDVEDYRARLLTLDAGAVQIRHVGTEFTLIRHGERLFASVRDGSIMLELAHTRMMLEALETHIHQVELYEGKAVRWNTVEKPDPAWRWISALD